MKISKNTPSRTTSRTTSRSTSRKRWVVKVGSNLVCSGGPLLIRAWMQQLDRLKKDYKIDVVWVTSGAIASAAGRLRLRKKKRPLPEKQALSAIGQPIIMDLYNLALQAQGLTGAQVLLTYDDLEDPARRLNFQNTVEKLLRWGVTPILNENDAVATEEIQFGDNDSLSAKVAAYVDAERLVILTDVDGLYHSDPRKSKDAQLIQSLPGVDKALLKRAEAWGRSTNGTGGMFSKLRAAREASENSIETWLAKGDIPNILVHLAEGQSVGTRIELPEKSTQQKTKGKKDKQSHDRR